jgi:hypothetical protein
MTSATASRAAQALIEAGLAVRIDDHAQYAIYALKPGAGGGRGRRTPYLRGSAYRAAEDSYIARRKAGASRRALEETMTLTPSTADVFEGAFRQQTTSGYHADNSCPKFADHDRHIAALAKVGAYPVMPALAGLRRCL